MTVNARPLAVLLGFAVSVAAAPDKPWQTLTMPSAAEAARVFAAPPPEYSAQFTWGWAGPVDRDVIARDLDGMKALGVYAAAIEAKTGMSHPYLSPGYFDLVRTAVAEAKQRNMRLWIMDEGDYPSGLAGGKFTTDRPDLRMKALAEPEHVSLTGGSTMSRDIDPDFICAVATNRRDLSTQVIEPHEGRLQWTAPAGSDWDVAIVRWVFRTMPTRSANNPANLKDATHSLMDYLSPEAAEQFKTWTFEGYGKTLGDELGRTVLGFRGDEPAYGFNPWTPRLLQEFRQRKSYDLRPYLAAFAATPAPRTRDLTDAQRRAYADYCDVWSDLFRDSYFDMEAKWCADHGVEMQLHIEHEEILPTLAITDGDFFKAFRHIQVPGIDIIWHQIWMDNPADFPKLASSAAHLYGRPRTMCEAFAAYRPAPDLKQARWLLDFLFSRGITRIEYMFWPASVPRGGFRPNGVAPKAPASDASGEATKPGTAAARAPGAPSGGGFGPRYYRDPGFPAVAAYVNRLSYLLGEGRPAADIGVYVPTSSFWLTTAERSQQINDRLLAIAHQLIERQRDFDFVDEQALASVLTQRGDRLVNLSGQGYRAIVVPPTAAISRVALDRLHAFAAAGGHVIFLGSPPALVIDKTFLDARGPADVRWATLNEPKAEITPAVLAALPPADVALETAAPLISYTHRQLADADVYFVFNSGDDKLATHATLLGRGTAKIWDANNGTVTALDGTVAHDGHVVVPLEIAPWATTVIVVGHEETKS